MGVGGQNMGPYDCISGATGDFTVQPRKNFREIMII